MYIVEYIEIQELKDIVDAIQSAADVKIAVLNNERAAIIGEYDETLFSEKISMRLGTDDVKLGKIYVYSDENLTEEKRNALKFLVENSINNVIKKKVINQEKEAYYKDFIDKSINMMEVVKEKSNALSKIQSKQKILALNASIEAARAGEKGEGFLVIANEVGKLSAKSKEINRDVAELVNDMKISLEELEKNVDLYKWLGLL